MILRYSICLIPVLLLLILMLSLDSMKLVNCLTLLLCLAWGGASAVLSFFLNTFLIHRYSIPFELYSGYAAPVVEEILKMVFLLLLVKRNRIGFMIDGAIYGFAVGAIFATAENLFYLYRFPGESANLMVWITRGFGTAVMHGGTTAIMAILLMSAINRHSTLWIAAITGTVTAILLHGVYNQAVIFPALATAGIILIIPSVILFIFIRNERSIRNWLELEFDSEVKLLRMIRRGEFARTRSGTFLQSIRNHFPAHVVFDMYCYISLYLELSIKAKAIMMLRENDIVPVCDPGIGQQITELKSLRRSIGHTGLLALAPVLRTSTRDLWKLELLHRNTKSE